MGFSQGGVPGNVDEAKRRLYCFVIVHVSPLITIAGMLTGGPDRGMPSRRCVLVRPAKLPVRPHAATP